MSHYLDNLRERVHDGILKQLFDPELQKAKEAAAAAPCHSESGGAHHRCVK